MECLRKRFQLAWQTDANHTRLGFRPNRYTTDYFEQIRLRYTNLFNNILNIHFISFGYE